MSASERPRSAGSRTGRQTGAPRLVGGAPGFPQARGLLPLGERLEELPDDLGGLEDVELVELRDGLGVADAVEQGEELVDGVAVVADRAEQLRLEAQPDLDLALFGLGDEGVADDGVLRLLGAAGGLRCGWWAWVWVSLWVVVGWRAAAAPTNRGGTVSRVRRRG
jgi:hypothetical protein